MIDTIIIAFAMIAAIGCPIALIIKRVYDEYHPVDPLDW
jgi:hypothetical protein